MSDIDFAMTYPAYVPLRPDGRPHTVRTGYGDGSIPLFTDEDTFERFVQDGPTNKISGRVTLDNCDAVCRLLRALDGSKVRGGVVVYCVAIDPDYEAPRALVYRIAEFVKHLESEA